MYFQFLSYPPKNVRNHYSQLFNLRKGLEIVILHIFEDGTKVEISFKIKLPLPYVAAHFMMFVGIKL